MPPPPHIYFTPKRFDQPVRHFVRNNTAFIAPKKQTKKQAYANLCKTHTAVCNFDCYCVWSLFIFSAGSKGVLATTPPQTEDALSSRRLSHFAKGRRSPRTTAFVDVAPPTLLLPLLPLYKEATEHFAFVVATVAVSRQIAPTAGKKYANKKKNCRIRATKCCLLTTSHKRHKIYFW